MSSKSKTVANASLEDVNTFNVQVCSRDGRLLSEYSLNHQDDRVKTLSAAENCACENLSDYKGEPLVVVELDHVLT